MSIGTGTRISIGIGVTIGVRFKSEKGGSTKVNQDR